MNYLVLLGLCSAKDAPLVRGTAKAQDKIDFLKEFTDLVVLHTSQSAISGHVAQGLLSDVVSDAKAILSPQITLFPSDMDPIYTVKGSSTPSVNVEGLISSVKVELDSISNKMALLGVQSVQPPPVPKRTDIEELKKEVHGQFVQLQKLMDRFGSIYDLEIKPWTRGDTGADLVGLGPQASQLLDLQQSLKNALSSVRQLKNGYQQIISPDSSSDLSRIDQEINEHAILAVQDRCAILEKAMERRHELYE